MGPQAIGKYLTYFAFSRIGEATGRAARDGVGGPLTFFLAPFFAHVFFYAVGPQLMAKYIRYFAFSRIGLILKVVRNRKSRKICPRFGTAPRFV